MELDVEFRAFSGCRCSLRLSDSCCRGVNDVLIYDLGAVMTCDEFDDVLVVGYLCT